jgi:hypothetical protein
LGGGDELEPPACGIHVALDRFTIFMRW